MQRALDWAAIASPALQLHAVQAHSLSLQHRLELLTTKRKALLASAQLLGTTREFKSIFALIKAHAKSLMEVEHSTLYIVDRKRELLFTMVTEGFATNEITMPLSEGLVGACFKSQQPINLRDAHEDPRFNKEADEASGLRTKTVLCFPVLSSTDEVIAIIQLVNKSTALEFTDEDEDLLCAFAGQVGISIVSAARSS